MMKFIFILSFLIYSFISFGQYTINQSLGSGNTRVFVPPNGALQASLINRVFTDTVSANLTPIKFYAGAQIYTSVDNLLLIRNSTATAWLRVTMGGDGLFARTDARNNTGSNMYFSAADNSFTIDSIQNFNVNATSGSINLTSAGGITSQIQGGSSLTINDNYAIYMDGNWGFKTTPTRTVSIGDDLSGGATLFLYAPNGTTSFVQSKSGAALSIAGGNSIYLQPSSYTSDGQIILSPTLTPGYIVQKFLTGGTGLIGEIGLGFYGDNENEFYFKAFNTYSPVNEDSVLGYINLYDKIKLTNIPNEDDLIKIIGIDDSNNVRYINATALGGGISALTGDVTASGTGSVAATLATVNSNVGSFTNASITVNAKGLITAASNGAGGSGTLTNVATGFGLSGGPITTTGTILADTTVGVGLIAYPRYLKFKDSVNSVFTPMTRTLTAGYGITGGGDLSANRSLIFDSATVFPQIRTSVFSGIANNRVAYSSSGVLTGSSQFTFTGQALQLASTNTTQTTTASALAQVYNSLTTGTGNYISSSSLSSGRLLELTVTGTAGLTNQAGLVISLSGANGTGAQTTYGLDVSNTHTGTSTNVAARFVASGGSNNTAAIFTGRVAMGGVTSPFADLDVGAGSIAAGSIVITTAAGTAATGNFSTSSTNVLGTNTGSLFQYDGSTNSDGRVYVGGTGATTIGAGRPYSTFIVGAATVPEASSGNHPFIGSAIFIPPSISTGAATVTDAATVRITGPTTAVVSGTNSALLINSGNLRMDNGSISLNTAGNKINIATGSNASIGTSAALVAGTTTVNTTAVTANSKIFLTVATPGGTQGFLSVGTIVPGTSFVINSSGATETSTVNWWIVN